MYPEAARNADLLAVLLHICLNICFVSCMLFKTALSPVRLAAVRDGHYFLRLDLLIAAVAFGHVDLVSVHVLQLVPCELDRFFAGCHLRCQKPI